MAFVFFFFSSRRRHTRSLRDWSSDVCSSDLPAYPPASAGIVLYPHGPGCVLPPHISAAEYVGQAIGCVLPPHISAAENVGQASNGTDGLSRQTYSALVPPRHPPPPSTRVRPPGGSSPAGAGALGCPGAAARRPRPTATIKS